MPFRKGLIRHDPTLVPSRLGAEVHPVIQAKLGAGPVGHQDYSSMLWGVFNQGECEGCWAHSEANLWYAANKIVGKPLSAPPSPNYLMRSNYARLRGIAAPAGKPLPLLFDTGATLADASVSSQEWGSIPFETPEQGGDTDVAATVDAEGNQVPMPELTQAEFEAGAAHTMSGEYSIAVDTSAPSLLMAALDAGILVWDGFYADQNFQGLQASEILGAPDTSQPGGGHSNLYWGYDLNASRAYLVDGPVFFKRNTWGSSWCKGGDYTVSTAHVAAAWYLWPYAAKVS